MDFWPNLHPGWSLLEALPLPCPQMRACPAALGRREFWGDIALRAPVASSLGRGVSVLPVCTEMEKAGQISQGMWFTWLVGATSSPGTSDDELARFPRGSGGPAVVALRARWPQGSGAHRGVQLLLRSRSLQTLRWLRSCTHAWGMGALPGESSEARGQEVGVSTECAPRNPEPGGPLALSKGAEWLSGCNLSKKEKMTELSLQSMAPRTGAGKR